VLIRTEPDRVWNRIAQAPMRALQQVALAAIDADIGT
jgi:hypothetical protein